MAWFRRGAAAPAVVAPAVVAPARVRGVRPAAGGPGNDPARHYLATNAWNDPTRRTGATAKYAVAAQPLLDSIVTRYTAIPADQQPYMIHDLLDELEQLPGVPNPGAAKDVVEAVRLLRSELAGRPEEKTEISTEFARFVQDAATMIRNIQALPAYAAAGVLEKQYMLRNAIRTLIGRLGANFVAADVNIAVPVAMDPAKVLDAGVAAAVTAAKALFDRAGAPAAPAPGAGAGAGPGGPGAGPGGAGAGPGGPGGGAGAHVAPPAEFANLLTALRTMANELHAAANENAVDVAQTHLDLAADAYVAAQTAAAAAGLPITRHLMNLATSAMSLGRRAPEIAAARAAAPGAPLPAGQQAAFDVLTATVSRIRTDGAAAADGPALDAATTFADPATDAAGQVTATTNVETQVTQATAAIDVALADPGGPAFGVAAVALTGPGGPPRPPLAGAFRGGRRRHRKTYHKAHHKTHRKAHRKAGRKTGRKGRKANRKTNRN
jgi:hypothetical protein